MMILCTALALRMVKEAPEKNKIAPLLAMVSFWDFVLLCILLDGPLLK